jgi:hypothetical protein
LLLNCAKIVADSGKAVVLCLDGFDTIVEHTAESRKAIFAGLIAAVHQYAKDPELCDAFCFKAFLPQELAEGAFVWDEDKFARHTHYLSWSEADFQEFLKRRLSPYAKTKSNRFLDVWHEFMPDKIHNDTHGTDEISFNYILRHTLYRPRQLLMHLQEIFDRWSENSNVARVDPSFIPRIVARTNYNLAKGVVDRLELAHPRLSVFMQSLRSAPSIMRTGEFQGRMKNIFKLEGVQDVADAFNVLFNFGIFGTAKESDMPKPGQEVRFGFGFIGDRIANVAASVDDRDYVALSPMFREYCGCTAAQWGPVIPVSTWIG